MWAKGDRDGRIQMLVHRHSATGQGRSELGPFQLPSAIGKAHRVIPGYHAFILQREHQIQILTPERHKGRAPFAGRLTETLVELLDVLLPEKTISLLQGTDLFAAQFRR